MYLERFLRKKLWNIRSHKSSKKFFPKRDITARKVTITVRFLDSIYNKKFMMICLKANTEHTCIQTRPNSQKIHFWMRSQEKFPAFLSWRVSLISSVFIRNAIGTILMNHVKALPRKLLKCLVLPILTQRYKRRQEITQRVLCCFSKIH